MKRMITLMAVAFSVIFIFGTITLVAAPPEPDYAGPPPSQYYIDETELPFFHSYSCSRPRAHACDKEHKRSVGLDYHECECRYAYSVYYALVLVAGERLWLHVRNGCRNPGGDHLENCNPGHNRRLLFVFVCLNNFTCGINFGNIVDQTHG